MTARGSRAARFAVPLSLAALLASPARGDVPLPPWVDDAEVAPPSWAQSVIPPSDDGALFGEPEDEDDSPVTQGEEALPTGPRGLVLFAEPNRASHRRGVSDPGSSLPFFGTKRGSGCSGPWWLVGPMAWTCSDDAQLSAANPAVPDRILDAGALASRYMFIRSGGASAYASLESAQDGEADEELGEGWAVAAVEERTADGARWVRTSKGLWLSRDDLDPARPSLFHGEKIEDGHLDIAWVLSDRASVWAAPAPKEKPRDFRSRFQIVRIRDDSGPMVEVGDRAWMLAADLARPRPSPPPADLTGREEPWIDVDSTSQTLVAYRGTRPVYATLVSTGRGADATPPGIHRVWVKILASDMGNVQQEGGDDHYSLEDVPYVQFFDAAVALHGTYWHGDFGHARSHGCVNLSPIDAHWMFDFTEPHVPAGWSAVYPSSIDPGSLVRVR